MAFFDFVKSDFQDQHKAKPKALTSVEEGKNVRIKMQAKERRSRRIDTFITNRGIEEDDAPLTPQLEGPAPKKQEVTDPRKKQMLLWKQERMKRKKLEPKKLPPFKVGVVRHAIAPFQEEIFKNPIKAHDHHSSNQRVTRSTARANLKGAQPSTSHPQIPPVQHQQQQKSFAPLDAKFHAPKVTIAERKNLKLKYTPRKPRREPAVKIFSNLFPSVENVKRSPEIKTKRKNSGKNEQSNKTKVNRNKTVTKDDSFSKAIEKEMKLHGLELARTTSLPSTPGNTPQGVNTPENIPKFLENGKDLFTSPEPSNTNLLISSPFVTFSRGKGSRQEENLCKKSFGYSAMSPEKTAQYFRLQLDGEIARLQGLCQTWKTYQEENRDTLLEESQELINVAIGQTTLLMTKKFEQFRGLIVRCETKEKREGEGMVTVQDLQGFWDMVYMQVENVDVRFNRLVELKSKNWCEDETAPAVSKAKKKPVGKSKAATKSSSGLKAMILAARMKTKGSAKQTLTPKAAADTNTFDGGFFSVISPVKNREEENELVKTSGKRTSMLKSVIGSEAKKRLSTKTPPSTAMAAILRASCLAKNVATEDCTENGMTEYLVAPLDLNRTPGRSILKTPGTNKKTSQNTRKSVKVLFRGEEEMENVPFTRPLTRFSISQNTDTLDNDVDMACEKNIIESKDTLEVEKPPKRARLTRQKAVHNDENESPSEDIETKSNKRIKRKKTQKKKHIDKTEEAEQNGITLHEVNTPVTRSTRLTQEFFSDLHLSDTPLAAEKISDTNLATRRHKRKSLDDRKSFNLITFSPDKPVRNTRSTLRRISTNTPTVRH